MKIFSAKLDEITVDLISIISYFGFSSFRRKFITDLSFFLCREEIWHFTTVQEVVDVFKEGLFDNLCI
jgi:hypothetical protein